MVNDLARTLSQVEHAAAIIFDADNSVRSVGVGVTTDGYGFFAVRNASAPVAFAAKLGASLIPSEVNGIPIQYVNSHMDPVQLARVLKWTPVSRQECI